MNNTMIIQCHKSKGIQKGTLLLPLLSPNIWVLYRAFHARLDIEASHRGLGREKTQIIKPLQD